MSNYIYTSTKDKDPIAVELGQRGGLATSKTHNSDWYRRLQALSVKSRLSKANKIPIDKR